MADSFDPQTLQRARLAALQKLESLNGAGLEQLGRLPDLPPLAAPTAAAPAVATAAAQPAATAAVSRPAARPAVATRPAPTQPGLPSAQPAPVLNREQRQQELHILQREVSICTLCPELAASRTQTVFGVGNPEPRLCFFGEAPGYEEDKQGEPFVGASGQLLNKIITACTMKREDVYILNTVKCRPPGNRNPAPKEVTCCRKFFERQLEILQPEFICCLGSVAAQSLLRTTLSVGRLRGAFHDYHGAKVIVTYHPSYLLRTPAAKRKTWDDMKMLMAEMGVEL